MPAPTNVSEVKQQGAEKANMAKEAIAARLDTVAEGIRQQAPTEGNIADAAKTVADKLEYTGEYIRTTDLSAVAKDVSAMIRRNPVPFIAAGLGLGFLITRAFRRD